MCSSTSVTASFLGGKPGSEVRSVKGIATLLTSHFAPLAPRRLNGCQQPFLVGRLRRSSVALVSQRGRLINAIHLLTSARPAILPSAGRQNGRPSAFS